MVGGCGAEVAPAIGVAVSTGGPMKSPMVAVTRIASTATTPAASKTSRYGFCEAAAGAESVEGFMPGRYARHFEKPRRGIQAAMAVRAACNSPANRVVPSTTRRNICTSSSVSSRAICAMS